MWRRLLRPTVTTTESAYFSLRVRHLILANHGTSLQELQTFRRHFHRFSKKIDPKGKAVFITGCDTGFGHDLALRLHDYGFHVFSGCLVPELNGGRKLQKLQKKGRMKVLQCDVTKWKEVRACSQLISKDLSKDDLKLWAVVNNAGVAVLSEFEWIPLEQYETMLNVNCMGSIRVVKAFLPLLRESQGRLIIMASLSGRYAVPGFTGYSMTKHAQIALADGLRRELRKFGISVSTIEPASYKTEMANLKMVGRQVERHWLTLPPKVQQSYGPIYFSALKVHLSRLAGLASPNSYEPVDKMMQAVTLSRMKPRYVAAPTSAFFRSTFLPYLPTSIQDFLMKKLSIDLPRSANKKK